MEMILLALNTLIGLGIIVFLFKGNNRDDRTSEKLVEVSAQLGQKIDQNVALIRAMTGELIEEKSNKQIKENAKNAQELIEKFSHLQLAVSEKLGSVSQQLNQSLLAFQENSLKGQSQNFENLIKTIDEKLLLISNQVHQNLDEGFKKTNLTFQSVIERLAKIDEAQKKIESLSSNVVSLQEVLTDKKSRGIFGEVQLHQILSSVFGEKNDRVYQLQYKLPNSTLVDAIIFLPEPTGNLAIDSKFPLENYRRMFDLSFSEIERKEFTKDFKTNLKKHIDDISSKYIIKDSTSDQAVLFLPAEAIFAEINAYHLDIVEYAQSKRVWIASPTTLMAMLTTIQVVLKNIETSRYAQEIQQELGKLGDEFSRYRKRWDNLASHLETVNKDVREIHTTTEKITNRFAQISDVKVEQLVEN